ncbi:pyridoxamine 5'-phosphate oxidase family protein [Actinokineospora enzanensis]|uniref:pyridoxamine 5'-phosphate oxidase family protein n=1 Tax=Actinokineospora enzanensis TaxID=155975 RepID=UPI0003730ED4|nr:pyridoxamine 5'-phosphate oxidase family protein [Actinokineospora enzanensis]
MSIDPLPAADAADTDLLRLDFPPPPRRAARALTAAMIEFVRTREAVFAATADAEGECASGLWTGPSGFVQVLGDRRLACAELGPLPGVDNLAANPHIGLVMVDAARAAVGLHVHGRATVVADVGTRAGYLGLPTRFIAARWVIIDVDEAYAHHRAPRR